jgi:GT2 family glycosyltransferase
MKLLIVIVCYKVVDLTIECLRSLAPEIGRVPGTRVALVENGTGGDSAERLGRAIAENGWDAWCDLTVIHPNLGFTGGNNTAIRPALAAADPPDYIMLLNSDTVVLDGALSPLVDFLDRTPRAGIAGSHCLPPPECAGQARLSHARFPGVLTELDRGLRLGLVSKLLTPWIASRPAAGGPARVDWVPGAAMIIRRATLDQIGLLDEGLYTYFDDVDLCLRARRAGWETWYIPESRIIHIAGATTGVTRRAAPNRVPAYWFQARRRCYLSNYGPARVAAMDAAFLACYATYRLRRRAQHKPDNDPPHYLADFFRQSVFRSGFRVEEVENPALRATPQEASA